MGVHACVALREVHVLVPKQLLNWRRFAPAPSSSRTRRLGWARQGPLRGALYSEDVVVGNLEREGMLRSPLQGSGSWARQSCGCSVWMVGAGCAFGGRAGASCPMRAV